MKNVLYSIVIFLGVCSCCSRIRAQEKAFSSHFTIARLKYGGGGDWYNDPSIIPNMLDFLRQHATINVAQEERRVSLMDEDLFSYPFLFMTGHGRISFSTGEIERLSNYLKSGGFLFADDDYGMDQYFRREMHKVFPDKEMVEVPFSHDIFFSHFEFPNGLPKIHEHDGGPPRAYAYFHEGRMVVFYSFNTNISDGWADQDVHGDPQPVREKAFEMGTNIIIYALTQ
ncbi:DUF4159 domain-containing protein [candidate division KSB1 bacterium]|nr:DUF4159 domain-containing protein [candidate division KSB1 bacterium]RQW00679.1 MAG: DUF4159 domain-containing protein [candidate division KSB1 bacterium]